MQQDINGLLQAIYDEHQKPLRVLALKMGIPEKDVDDIVQETIIAYYQHYPLDWTLGHKRSMLATINRHKCIDYFRKNQKEWLILDSEEFKERQEGISRYGGDMIDHLYNEEIRQDMDHAFSQLKKDMAMTAKLHLVDGIPEKEVADMLGITAVACRARVSRAKKILRKLLGPKYGF